jgi:GNAT superfamily N-acetyltransferase
MPVVRRGRREDADALLELIAEFYAIDKHAYDRGRVVQALMPLLADDAAGQVWVLASPDQPALAGYAIVTWSYSLESGGRDCILDEIYVRDRGGGLGSVLLRAALQAAAEAGAAAMFLETEAHNVRVRAFYRRHGFAPEDSVWMRTDLPASAGSV